MLTNLLTNNPVIATIPEAALYALIGYLVVFFGIAFLIFVVWLVGLIMQRSTSKGTKIAKQEAVKISQPIQSDDIDEETVAVIMAALTAYYETNHPKCEFTVKRIKRIRRNDYA
jgi:sodium pump decarboxylase gamma subunit